MRLKILLPYKIMVDEEVTKIVAEAENGSFGILPRHIDFVTILVPGILFFESKEEEEEFIAIDEGVLVKQGDEVFVSTRNAIQEKDLSQLQKTVEQEFLNSKNKIVKDFLKRNIDSIKK